MQPCSTKQSLNSITCDPIVKYTNLSLIILYLSVSSLAFTQVHLRKCQAISFLLKGRVGFKWSGFCLKILRLFSSTRNIQLSIDYQRLQFVFIVSVFKNNSVVLNDHITNEKLFSLSDYGDYIAFQFVVVIEMLVGLLGEVLPRKQKLVWVV